MSADAGKQDELVAMEENYCSIELVTLGDVDDDDKLTTAIFQIQHTLLNHRPLYLQISRNEFAALLLKALGPSKISSSVVDELFNEIDVDNDGWLSTEELARHLIKVEQKCRKRKYQYFYDRLGNASILGSLLFLCASTLSIKKNLFTRVQGEFKFPDAAVELVVWFSLIGSVSFVWGALRGAVLQLRNSEYQSVKSKIGLLLKNFTTIGQVINMLWLLGSLAYVLEQWLAGGLCYFVGGLLAFPSIYQGTLAELVQNHELVCKLRNSITEYDQVQGNDEEMGLAFVPCREKGCDVLSSKSDLTIAVSKVNVIDTSKFPTRRMHKRVSTDSNVIIDREFFVREDTHLRHRRAPTCPADVFNRVSIATCETASLTESECSADDGTADDTSTWTSLVGKDIVAAKPKNKTEIDCYDAFISFGDSTSRIDESFRVIKRLSLSSAIDMVSIRQLASEKTKKDIQMAAFRQLFQQPSLYIAIAYTIGGFMFTIGECHLDLSPSGIQNIYLTGSSLYFCGSTGILYRAWLQVHNEWNLLQDSCMALHAMAFSPDTEPEDAFITTQVCRQAPAE